MRLGWINKLAYLLPSCHVHRRRDSQGTDYVENIMDEFDTDGDGMMDIDEFKVMMHVLYTGQRKKGIFDTLRSLFQDSSHAIFQHDVLTDREIEK